MSIKLEFHALAKRIAAIGLFLTTATSSMHGEIFTGNARLTTQGDVDGFSNVSEITGTLTISTDPTKGDPIVNLNGLGNLASVGDYLFINDNSDLVDTLGLLGLTDVKGLYIFGNGALPNLDGLSNLVVCDQLEVHSNPNLTQFCGLHLLFLSQGSNWDFFVVDSNYQMYFDGFGDILTLIGEPCELPTKVIDVIDPQAYIASLLDSGALNKGQANSLLKQLQKNSLKAMANHLKSFVKGGVLSEEEASPLIEYIRDSSL